MPIAPNLIAMCRCRGRLGYRHERMAELIELSYRSRSTVNAIEIKEALLQEMGTQPMDRPETETGTKLDLAMSIAERKLIDNMDLLNEAVVVIQQSPKKAVQLSLSQLDDLADALSVRANHADDKRVQRRLDTFVRKIDQLTGNHLRSVLATKNPGIHPAGSLSGRQEAKRRRATKPMRAKPMLAVTLSPAQREILESVCARKCLQQRLHGDGRQTIEFTHREIEYLHNRGQMQADSASSRRKERLLSVCNKIGKILGEPRLARTPSRKIR